MKDLSKSKTTYLGAVSIYIFYGKARRHKNKYLVQTIPLPYSFSCCFAGENQLLVEGEIAEAHPCQFCVLEGTMKMKVKAHDDGRVVIEFSKTFTKLPKFSKLKFPTVRIRGNFDYS